MSIDVVPAPRSVAASPGSFRIDEATIIEAAPDLGIAMLTLYAFSSDNWKRPRPEVSALMQLFSEYLQKEVAELAEALKRIADACARLS